MDDALQPHDSLYELDSLYATRDTLAAPFTAAIQALEYDRALATAEVDAKIATLEPLCRSLVLALGKTVYAGPVTCSYQSRTHWDSKGLLAYEKEQPTILQFHEVRPLVSLATFTGLMHHDDPPDPAGIFVHTCGVTTWTPTHQAWGRELVRCQAQGMRLEKVFDPFFGTGSTSTRRKSCRPFSGTRGSCLGRTGR